MKTISFFESVFIRFSKQGTVFQLILHLRLLCIFIDCLFDDFHSMDDIKVNTITWGKRANLLTFSKNLVFPAGL